MNETTLFLSQLIGPVIAILGLSFLLKHQAYHKLFKKMYKDSAFLFLTAIVELTTGIAIVLYHNLWTNLPEILISLIAWGMIMEGTLVLVNDKIYIKKLYHVMSPIIVALTGLTSIIFGGYLIWLGYLV